MREKLIKLLKNSLRESGEYCGENTCQKCQYDKYGGDCGYAIRADYFIANGVTLETDNNVGCKWIPVTDRLPHPNEVVMTWSQQRADLEVMNVLADFEMGDVTHWMPLPEPPKGE